MKRNAWYFLVMLALVIGLGSCSDNDENNPGRGTPDLEGTTYMGLTLKLPSSSGIKTRDDSGYNNAGEYSGVTEILTVDLYLLSPDASTLLFSRRFTRANGEYVYGTESDNSDIIKLSTPFKTAAGDKMMIVIINSPEALMTTIPSDTYLYTLSSTMPISSLARVDYDRSTTTPEGITVYADILTLSGKSTVFNILDNISSQEVTSSGKNTIDLDVTRLPSRAIITTSAPSTVTNSDGITLGTISDLTYSVAQGANAVYLFPQVNADNTVFSWGYNYLSGPGVDYNTTASNYYDYSDLQNLTDVIPAKPSDGSQMTFPGKFLLETTHLSGADASSTQYRKGNTPYILVRAKFVPAPAQIVDGGTLTDGTFYIGGTDNLIYSSIEAAQSTEEGFANLTVYTYTNGKVLYYVWLNPDNIQKPVNSPIIRNNIYHVNINSFKSIGYNWNPLLPPGSNIHNPDPQPSGPEPEIPVDPDHPLSSTDTYMNVEIKMLMWKVHTYDIDL